MTDDKTDPNLKVPSLLPDASRSDIVFAVNRSTKIVEALCEKITQNTIYCPLPGQRCAALDMAETAAIGIVEDRAARIRGTKTIALLGSAAVVVAAVIGVVGAAVFQGQATAAVHSQVPEIVRIEVGKYQNSTESIAFEAAKDGAMEGLRQFRAEQQAQPLQSKPDKLR